MRASLGVAVSLAREALARGEMLRVHCRGTSMMPTLRDGDCVEIAMGARAEIGDVVLVADGDTLVLHRLIARLPGARLAHSGDAGFRTAGLTKESSIVGVARMRRERAGAAARWVTALWVVARAAAGRYLLGRP
jgi:hypothetical protein